MLDDVSRCGIASQRGGTDTSNIDSINFGSQISNLYSGRRSNDTLFVDGKMGVARAPGAVQVLDKASGRLVDCSQSLCPYAANTKQIKGLKNHPYGTC